MTTVADLNQVTLVPRGTWEVDAARSTVGFEVRHLKLMRVHGRFHEIAAVISWTGAGLASIAASINVASIDTGDPRRDARLCAHDFFDAEHHATISFTGESCTDDALLVRGKMTIRAVSRPLELRAEPAQAPHGSGDGELRIRAHGALSRREFGLDWDTAFAAGGLVIDDHVVLRLDVVLVRRTS